MKVNSINKIAGSLIITVFMCFSPAAFGRYEIIGTIDGGAGTSSGGQYIVTGTIGQPNAALSSSDDYELVAGFWPDAPLCIVDLEHFAAFAQYWLEMGTGLPPDLYKDENNIVDYYDLNVFIYEWLYYCPYDWPLR